MTDLQNVRIESGAVALLPEAARRYLAHTTEGRPIREIAREAGCHASTVLRQVRKLETLRDDPMVDRALAGHATVDAASEAACASMDDLTDALRQLCQPRAMMLYNADLRQPAIVKTVGEGETVVLGAIDLDLAAALVLRNWIAADGGTAVKRYRVTEEGRSNVPGLVAARDTRAAHALEDALGFGREAGPDRRSRDRSLPNGPGFESPLTALARRRGPDGRPFLPKDFVAAGDRLYEDYAIAGFTASDLLGWDCPSALDRLRAKASALTNARRFEAAQRTLDAVGDLGPGLSEVVLRCCCLREGLEATEKRLGWSARSGKVVLRIALQRLALFYAGRRNQGAGLIG
ncbi:DUF6456 domain-containing protein [uncultured Marivita sp.]|uniref:DUF6456 domain-containing protein n=1 Tax=uncultured Marivita sp. TaxID=888080 RepID=UPI00260B0322|nr:DUF6456 domain-containing protein [uncultured Marivita sp.]